MKEYMLLIYDRVNHHDELTESKFHEFLKKCEVYILHLQKEEQLIAAQPLAREGIVISGKKDNWKEEPYNEKKEIQVGYYHILAKNMEEAISIAKGNPEFEYGSTVRIEVRPIRTKEVITDFEYPKTTVTT